MRYLDRHDVERIGRVGAYYYEEPQWVVCRMLSSYWLTCEKDDTAFTPWAKQDGMWEAWITCWLSNATDPDANFYDVGANVGYYTFWAQKHGCQVVAIEPNKNLVPFLVNSAKLNNTKRSVEILNAAFGAEVGKGILTVPPGHSGAASLFNIEGQGYLVDVITFDSFRIQDNRPLVVKIDAEGSEPDILKGMRRTLENSRAVVVLEWHSSRWEDPNIFADQLWNTGNVCIIGEGGQSLEWTKNQLVSSTDLHMVVVQN